MKASDDLFLLIRNMSMSEKRQFKIHSTRHVIGEKSNYVGLFDAIAAQQEYDEEAIKKQFSDTATLRHFPSEKSFLYQNILDSLNQTNRHRTFLSRYCQILTSIELLYSKGLFRQCKKIIEKAKPEAYSLEKFSILLLLLRWEVILDIKDEDEAGLNRNFNEEARILETMRIYAAFMQLAFTIQVRVDRGKMSDAFLKEVEERAERLYPRSEKHNCFWTRYYYYSAKGLIYSVQQRANRRNNCYERIKEIMDEQSQFIQDLPAIYNLNLNNLINGRLLLQQYDEVDSLISMQRNFMRIYSIKNSTLEKVNFLNTTENELYLYYKTGNRSAAAQLVKQAEAVLKKIPSTFSPVVFDVYFFVAVSEFLMHNYTAALRWLNKMLNAHQEQYFRPELHLNARLLYLAVLFESDDWLFENRYQSTARLFRQYPKNKLQQVLLQMLQLLYVNKPGTANKKQYKILLSQAKRLRKTSNEEKVNKTFDFIEWMIPKGILQGLA